MNFCQTIFSVYQININKKVLFSERYTFIEILIYSNVPSFLLFETESYFKTYK